MQIPKELFTKVLIPTCYWEKGEGKEVYDAVTGFVKAKEKQGAESAPSPWLCADHSWLKCWWHLQNPSSPPVLWSALSAFTNVARGGGRLGNPCLHLPISISSHNNPQKTQDTAKVR